MAEQRREDIRIPSHGEQLAAYLYRPTAGDRKVPCVVMAHGFTCTRDDGLPAYAETFRHAGFAVILFDYRHFGASTGEPRQLLDIGRQLDDYRTVVAWARASSTASIPSALSCGARRSAAVTCSPSPLVIPASPR